jgi:hypothetical protein
MEVLFDNLSLNLQHTFETAPASHAKPGLGRQRTMHLSSDCLAVQYRSCTAPCQAHLFDFSIIRSARGIHGEMNAAWYSW